MPIISTEIKKTIDEREKGDTRCLQWEKVIAKRN